MGQIIEVGKRVDVHFGKVTTHFCDAKISKESAKKWMRIAKSIKEVENPCYSRAIGVVLVDPDTNALISSGHNGPPANCPKNDDPEYLAKVVWPQLTVEEQKFALLNSVPMTTPPFPIELLKDVKSCDIFSEAWGCKKTCPRKVINAPSGKRLELCTCIHGETDAIVKAKGSGSRVAGAFMFAYCGVPCIECTKLIINSSIDTVVAINHGREDYSPYSSRWLFEKSKVNLTLVKEEWIWED